MQRSDTLTLLDRVTHHYTTGLSTIEVASTNATRLLNEFKKFFDDSRQGKGNTTKAYMITTDNRDKLNAVEDVLTKNGIEYGLINAAILKVLIIVRVKKKQDSLKKYHLAVSTSQPRSVMAKVLLEPSAVYFPIQIRMILPHGRYLLLTMWMLMQLRKLHIRKWILLLQQKPVASIQAMVIW